jgi:hypothetical protein
MNEWFDVPSIGTTFALVSSDERFRRRGGLGDLFMATYLNPESDVMPCASCGRDVSDLLIQSMTVDVACSCGAPIVIGSALFDEADERSVGSRVQL